MQELKQYNLNSMNIYKKIVREMQIKLGMEVNLEQMMLIDGVTKIEADFFEAGAEVFVVTEDEQKIALPIGEYELENGMMMVITEEGIISEVKEKQAEEEPTATEVEQPEMAQDTSVQTPQPKSIIESTSKEYKFSQEDMDAKDIKIAELEAKILELSKVDEQPTDIIEFKEEPKPISFNPENKDEEVVQLFGKNKPETKLDKIFKIYNEQ
jgi:hypothetical protein